VFTKQIGFFKNTKWNIFTDFNCSNDDYRMFCCLDCIIRHAKSAMNVFKLKKEKEKKI